MDKKALLEHLHKYAKSLEDKVDEVQEELNAVNNCIDALDFNTETGDEPQE